MTENYGGDSNITASDHINPLSIVGSLCETQKWYPQQNRRNRRSFWEGMMEEATQELAGSAEHEIHKEDVSGDNVETVAKSSINHKYKHEQRRLEEVSHRG